MSNIKKLQGLYVITEVKSDLNEDIIETTAGILAAGANIIQYRDKVNSIEDQKIVAQKLRELTNRYECLFIVNDHIEVAMTCDADGIHLGKDDASIQQARKELGNNKIIGASCYASYENAEPAIRESADYIAFGSFFPSATKPKAPKASVDLLKRAKKEFSTPICAIGGITTQNAHHLINAGADMIAVISSIYNASSPSRAVQKYLSIM